MRAPLAWISLLALLAPAIAGPAQAADPVLGIPPDGPAGPVRSLTDLATWVPPGSMVTTNRVQVATVSCPNCPSATTAADFRVTEGGRTMRVHVEHTWQATYNVKKQMFVPQVGQSVVVQGRLELVNGERFLELKRFGEDGHFGPTVKAYDVAAGRYPTGTYVWLSPVVVLNEGRWDDGDRSFDVRDVAGGGMVHLEVPPAFYGQLRTPAKGEVIQPYGMVRYDPDHGWYEMHPMRCLTRTECVPLAADFVMNGPIPGTPAPPGYYAQGGPVPWWIPITSVAITTPTTTSTTPTTTSTTPVTTVASSTSASSPTSASSSGAPTTTSASSSQTSKSSSSTSPPATGAPGNSTGVDGASSTGNSTGTTGTTTGSTGTSGTPTGNSSATATGETSATTTATTEVRWFAATFTPSPNSNAWWLQVRVDGRNVTVVEASVNGAPWVRLDHASWGDWVKSVFAPQGAQVRFRATDSSGAGAMSPAIPWVPATSVAYPSVEPGAAPFAATFLPNRNSNEWWLQVAVQATLPIAGVDASVDGGAWVPLDRAPWGEWIRSVHAPSGSEVRFKAITTDGQWKESPPVKWVPKSTVAYPAAFAVGDLVAPLQEPGGVEATTNAAWAEFVPSVASSAAYVEVAVRSARPLASVAVQAGSTEWRELLLGAGAEGFGSQLPTGGHWTFHHVNADIPRGSLVGFRAVDAEGHAAYSYSFSWPPRDD